MKDKIILKGMQFFGYHGVLEEERRLGQKFIVDMELRLNLQPAGRQDDLDLSISYAEVFQTVEAVVTGRSFRLLEALAESISQRVLEQYPPVTEVLVRVEKPGAPIPGNFAYMAVEITRRKEELP